MSGTRFSSLSLSENPRTGGGSLMDGISESGLLGGFLELHVDFKLDFVADAEADEAVDAEG